MVSRRGRPMMRLLAVIIAAGLAAGCGRVPSPAAEVEREGKRPRAAPQPPPDPTRLPTPVGLFPVITWGGPPEDQTTVERYRELAETGFTQNCTSRRGLDATLKALDVAKEAGVMQIVSCPDVEKGDPGPAVKRLKDHPALGGYFVVDEPGAGDFATVAAQVKRIQAADDRHPCYVNLFPNYATAGKGGQLGTDTYQDYVDRFVREVPVPILSLDHYPVITGFGPGAGGRASLRPEWYENLEVITTAARKAGKPVWAFAL